MLKYTDDHEWLALDGDVATVGITQYAVEQLGDVVYTEVPKAGGRFRKGARAALVESVKTASDILCPLDGEIVEGNESVVSKPELVNEDPMGKAWFFRIRLDDPAEADGLMSEADYQKMIAQ